MKKIITFLLVMILAVPANLYAGEMDKTLTNLITSVKEKVYVPKELTEFNYSAETQSQDTTDSIYRLTWNDKEYKLGQVQVLAEGNGNIIQYNKSMYNEKYSILAKVSYEEGLKRAKAFLSKTAGHYSSQLKLDEENNIGQDNTYEYSFSHYVNGVKAANEQVSVSVNKQTGEVVRFDGIETFSGNYKNGKAALSLEQAKQAYLSEIGIELIYHINYDYKTKTLSSFPVYEINNIQNKAIDAETGAVIVPVSKDRFYPVMKEALKADKGAAAGSINLTPQEQKSVEETKGLITKEDAVKAASKFFPRLKAAVINNASLYQSSYEKQYTWQINLQTSEENSQLTEQRLKAKIAAGDMTPNTPESEINYKSINLSVNAKTGEVQDYYYDTNHYDKENQAEMAAVKQKVEAFLKTISKDKFLLVKYEEQEMAKTPYQSFRYTRIVNGIPVSGDGFYITYDTVSDEIVGYSNTWNQVEFKDVTQVISKNKIADNIGLQLMYIDKDKKTRVLAYAHEKSYRAFDPFTGDEVNRYDGKPVRNSKKIVYNDISGHPKEAVIKKLYESGIYLPGNSFKPDTEISQADFLRLVLRVTDENITDKELYEQAVSSKIIDEKEKLEASGITKEQAVKYIINSMGYKEIAQMPELYVYPYKDEEAVAKELKGYVTLAYGLKIIEKDKTNLFNPKGKVTRAEAAQMMYNVLIQEK